MRPSGSTWTILAAWLVLVGGYAAAALLLHPGSNLTAFGDIMQCIVPLFANAGLLLNAGSSNWRKNAFWMLLALGCTLWLGGQLLWTYVEVYRLQQVPNPYFGDIIFFLHTVPMIAALSLQPHKPQSDVGRQFGYLDFSLLSLWWVYLYLFTVIPWQYVIADPIVQGRSFVALYAIEDTVLLIGLAFFCFRTSGSWLLVYANLFGAATLNMIGTLTIDTATRRGTYYTGGVYDIPAVVSFVWFGTAGVLAYRRLPAETPQHGATRVSAEQHRKEGVWAARLAMAAVLSLPVLALWCLLSSSAPPAVRHFRMIVTLIAVVPLTFLVFLRQRLVDADRLRLLSASEDSLDNLKRLQSQFVQAEKLASLGQLAAGAAHEINNPLTAIMGYSDLLIDDETISEKPRSIATKIREQARRTKTLVTHLLSFARQVPAERTLLDVNAVVTSAIQLRGLDLRGKNIRIELQTESALPRVRGDANQLLQIFFNIITNAVDAMEEIGGGLLTVRTLRERGNVVVELADTGPGIKDPLMVFDPFYTTKPVGKGTGLGLSICYGLVQEHGGHIYCYNRPEGGAVFRVEIPAIKALFPTREPLPASPAATKFSG